MQSNQSMRTALIIVLVLILAIVGYNFLTAPDNRSTGQRISDAANELPHGIGKAGDELKDRTPGQKLGDAVEHTGENIKDNTR